MGLTLSLSLSFFLFFNFGCLFYICLSLFFSAIFYFYSFLLKSDFFGIQKR